MLYDDKEPANPEFSYWTYSPFDLENCSDNKCNAEFKFCKSNIYSLVDALRIPNEVRCPNGQFIDAIEVLCVLLKRNSYSSRFSNLISTFGISVTELCFLDFLKIFRYLFIISLKDTETQYNA